jgi:hypothetical protein
VKTDDRSPTLLRCGCKASRIRFRLIVINGIDRYYPVAAALFSQEYFLTKEEGYAAHERVHLHAGVQQLLPLGETLYRG